MKKFIVSACIIFSAITIGIACTPPPSTSIYYVATAGSDSNDGLAATTGAGGHGPWKTIAKVNSASFPAGSTISFNGGDNFTGCAVFSYATNMASSSAASPITVNSYGTGVATITSNCTGKFSSAVIIDGLSGFNLQNLTIAGGSSTDPPGSYSIWNPSPEGTNYLSGASNTTVGTTFIPNVAGSITDLKFLKASTNTTTTRKLILWSSVGANLAQCTTSAEPTGTQQWIGCHLATAFTVAPGTTYVVSYDLPSNDTFNSVGGCVSRASITCLTTTYTLSGISTFPATPSGSAYFADVVFASTATSGPTPLTSIGVLVTNNRGAGSSSHVTIQNNDISNFSDSLNYEQGEIFVAGDSIPQAKNGAIDSLSILGNNLHGQTVTSPDGMGVNGYGFGQNITNTDYSGNTVYNLGGAPSHFSLGLSPNGVNGGKVTHNLIRDIGANNTTCGGPSGIETYTSNNILIEWNEVYNVKPTTYTTGCDFVGIDFDGGTSNSVARYNYTHGNFGPGYLFFDQNVGGFTWTGNELSENISENDAIDTGSHSGGILNIQSPPPGPFKVYNNTFYNTVNQSASNNQPACINANAAGGAWPAGTTVENNICYLINTNSFGTVTFILSPTAITGATWDNNEYYTTAGAIWRMGATGYTTFAAYKTAMASAGLDQNSITSNPNFTSGGTGGTCTWTPSSGIGPQPCPAGYALAGGSPALSAGYAVTPTPSLNYYGATWARNIGAF